MPMARLAFGSAAFQLPSGWGSLSGLLIYPLAPFTGQHLIPWLTSWKEISLEQCSIYHGTTAALTMLNDAVRCGLVLGLFNVEVCQALSFKSAKMRVSDQHCQNKQLSIENWKP